MAGCDTAAHGLVAAGVHRAEPSVPDGQPGGVRPHQSSAVHRRPAHVPLFAASHWYGRRARRLPEGRREDRAPGRCDLRRVPGVRARLLHVPGRLPSVCQWRRHGTPQQHGHDRGRLDRRLARRRARHGRPRILPLLERRAHPAERSRTVRFRSCEPVGRALAGRGLHAVLRTARDAARAARGRGVGGAHVRATRRERLAGPGASRALGGGNEPHGAIHRRRPLNRSHELVRDGHLVLPVRRRDRAGAGSDAARSQRRPALARRFHAGNVEDVRQTGRQSRGLRRPSVHDYRRRRDACLGERRPGIRARFLCPLHPGTRRRRLSAPAGARRLYRPEASSRSSVARRSPPGFPGRAARRCARASYMADLRGRPR